MRDDIYILRDNKLFEAIADIAYIAGQEKYYSGDSRADMSSFIYWAKEFERLNENTDWDKQDYILAIEEFALKKLQD